MRLTMLVTALTGIALIGCGDISKAMVRTWYEKFDWKAEKYFDDPQAASLCHAIQNGDIEEINRLAAAGVNVNAMGKDQITPLLWAFPSKNLDSFNRLLELGADPNVVIKSDLNTHGGFAAGDSVTHMSCRTELPGYFDSVFSHGGDPNLVKNSTFAGDTPIFSLIMGAAPDKAKKLQFLVSKGADLNHVNGTGSSAAMVAVGWGGRYDLALALLNAGADYGIYKPKSNTKLVHMVAMEERRKPTWTQQQAEDYQKLVDWLEAHGESIAVAKTDLRRWQSWGLSSGEYQRKMAAEVSERKSKEAEEEAANHN